MFRKRRRRLFNRGIIARSLADYVVGKTKKVIGIAPRRKHRPTKQVRTYAMLARQAYRGDQRSQGVGVRGASYHYAPEYSTEEEAVYFKDDEVVYSIRGTANAGDVVTDLNLGLGQLEHTQRAQSTRQHFKKLLDEGVFGDRRIVVVGHSLGGSLTNMLGNEFDGVIAETHAFNPGGSLRTQNQGLFSRKRKRSQKRVTQGFEHYIEADPIGAMARHQSENTVEVYDQLDPTLNVHTIDNFF